MMDDEIQEMLTDMMAIAKDELKKEQFSMKFVMFFDVEGKEGRIEIVAQYQGDRKHIENAKQSTLESVKEAVQQFNIEEYYVFMNGTRVNPKKLRELTQSMISEVTDKKSLMLCILAMKVLEEIPPSEHPCQEDVLVVTRCHKEEGMDAISCTYKQKGDKITFSKKNEFVDGTMNNRFNIWNPVQVDLNDATR